MRLLKLPDNQVRFYMRVVMFGLCCGALLCALILWQQNLLHKTQQISFSIYHSNSKLNEIMEGGLYSDALRGKGPEFTELREESRTKRSTLPIVARRNVKRGLSSKAPSKKVLPIQYSLRVKGKYWSMKPGIIFLISGLLTGVEVHAELKNSDQLNRIVGNFSKLSKENQDVMSEILKDSEKIALFLKKANELSQDSDRDSKLFQYAKELTKKDSDWSIEGASSSNMSTDLPQSESGAFGSHSSGGSGNAASGTAASGGGGGGGGGGVGGILQGAASIIKAAGEGAAAMAKAKASVEVANLENEKDKFIAGVEANKDIKLSQIQSQMKMFEVMAAMQQNADNNRAATMQTVLKIAERNFEREQDLILARQDLALKQSQQNTEFIKMYLEAEYRNRKADREYRATLSQAGAAVTAQNGPPLQVTRSLNATVSQALLDQNSGRVNGSINANYPRSAFTDAASGSTKGSLVKARAFVPLSVSRPALSFPSGQMVRGLFRSHGATNLAD